MTSDDQRPDEDQGPSSQPAPPPGSWNAPQPDPPPGSWSTPPPAPPPGSWSAPPPGPPPGSWSGAQPAPPPGSWGPDQTAGWEQSSGAQPGGRRPLLRPMNLGDILDGGFRLLTANWRAILIISGVFLVPTQLVGAYLQKDIMGGVGFLELMSGDPLVAEQLAQQDAVAGAGPLIGSLILGVLTLLALPFIAGAISKVVASSYTGQRLDAGPALAATGRHWWSLLASWVMVHVIELGPAFIAIGLVVVGATAASPGVVIIGVLLILAAMLAILPIMALFVAVAPAIVVEGLGPVAAMRRSSRLMRRRFWPVLGAAVVSGLLASLISGALGFLPQTAALFIGMHRAWPLVGVGAIIANLVTLPFVANVATLLYFDARIRQEGFDLQVMAAELGGGRGQPWGGPAGR